MAFQFLFCQSFQLCCCCKQLQRCFFFWFQRFLFLYSTSELNFSASCMRFLSISTQFMDFCLFYYQRWQIWSLSYLWQQFYITLRPILYSCSIFLRTCSLQIESLQVCHYQVFFWSRDLCWFCQNDECDPQSAILARYLMPLMCCCLVFSFFCCIPSNYLRSALQTYLYLSQSTLLRCFSYSMLYFRKFLMYCFFCCYFYFWQSSTNQASWFFDSSIILSIYLISLPLYFFSFSQVRFSQSILLFLSVIVKFFSFQLSMILCCSQIDLSTQVLSTDFQSFLQNQMDFCLVLICEDNYCRQRCLSQR